jgi:hypothetical protein
MNKSEQSFEGDEFRNALVGKHEETILFGSHRCAWWII